MSKIEGYSARQVLEKIRKREKKLLTNHVNFADKVNRDVQDINYTLNRALMFIMDKGLYAEFLSFEADQALSNLIHREEMNG